MEREVIAKNKLVRISPRKLRLVADVIRGKQAVVSLDTLAFLPKKGSDIIAKVLKSAIANAKNNFSMNIDELYVKEILVNEGPTYKRVRIVSKGRMRSILKRTSSVYIKLSTKKINGTKD